LRLAIIVVVIQSFIAICLGCRQRASSEIRGTGGLVPSADEKWLVIPLVKYQTDFHGKICPEGQAFFSFCGANRVAENIAMTSRHCIMRDIPNSNDELLPSNVLWFDDHVAMHDALNVREECLDIQQTLKRLKSAGGKEVAVEGIISPQKDGRFIHDPDIAFIKDERFRQSKFNILKLHNPDSLAPGTTITKIGFGTTDCRQELSPELKQKYPGYDYQYDRHAVTQYGASKTYAELFDQNSMRQYSPKNAASRDFQNFIYYLAGKDGMYSCLSDSSAVMVQLNGEWRVVGAHIGGVPIYDESGGKKSKDPTPFKLELAVKVSAPNVCAFVAPLAEIRPVFSNLCGFASTR
jgi:hypothetical protein